MQWPSFPAVRGHELHNVNISVSSTVCQIKQLVFLMAGAINFLSNSEIQCYRHGAEWLESGPEEKALGLLVDK